MKQPCNGSRAPPSASILEPIYRSMEPTQMPIGKVVKQGDPGLWDGATAQGREEQSLKPEMSRSELRPRRMTESANSDSPMLGSECGFRIALR